MLVKSMYDSWASRIRLFIKGKKHGRIMLDSIDNGPLVYPTVEENGQTRPMKYFKLTKAQQLKDDCDVQATNIILHGLLLNVYALVNHQEAAKDIWDRVKMLMKGTELSYQECECRLYNLFDNFTYVQEWSKFITDVKLAKSLYTTNYDQLYADFSQHKRHANEVLIMRERYSDPLALHGEDPIECINKAMAFLSAVVSRFPPSNNQLRTYSNPRYQATIQDARVTVQQVQRRQIQSYAATRNKGIATTLKENFVAGQLRVVKCYNCQREGHMARQCNQPKMPRNAAWLKEKLMLAKAQEAGQILDEEKLAFLAEPDYDDLSSAKAVLMANLSSCDPELLSEDNFRENQKAPTFNQLFELNELKAQSQEKDTVIRKLKDMIKSLSGKDSLKNVKKDNDEIETINIELEHNLNDQLQEKVFAITALKNELRKLEGKNVVDTVVSKPNATIALGMLKLDIEPISPRLKNNRDDHEVYIEKTIEYTDTLRGFVKRARTMNPSEPIL
nr:hypothetical protein [Tanacetum cinerariifolium]